MKKVLLGIILLITLTGFEKGVSYEEFNDCL